MTRSVEIPDAALKAAANALTGTWTLFGSIPDLSVEVARAALVAARPYLMPTEVEIAERVRQIFMEGGAARTHAQEAAAEIAHAVVALLNGES